MRLFRELFGMAIVMLAILATGCHKSDDNKQPAPKPVPGPEVEPGIAVTYNSIDGAWQLETWNDNELTEDTKLYIEFKKDGRSFEMWDNLNSMYMVQTTGGFAITQDDEQYILTGWYDYGVGDWSSNYIVSMDAHGDYMFWVRMSDNDQNGEGGNDRMAFKKIDNIPAF